MGTHVAVDSRPNPLDMDDTHTCVRVNLNTGLGRGDMGLPYEVQMGTCVHVNLDKGVGPQRHGSPEASAAGNPDVN